MNIGIYTADTQNPSSYIEELRNNKNSILLLNDQSRITDDLELDMIILDYVQDINENIINEVCKHLLNLQDKKDLIIFVLQKETMKMNRLIYLNLGANGVFDQQVDPMELTLIVSNISKQKYHIEDQSLPVENEESEGPLKMIPEKLAVYLEDGREVSLTRLEYQLLEFLRRKNGEVATYKEIFELVWGKDIGIKQYRVANLIFHIRKKIELHPSNPKYLKTVRTIGYVLKGDNEK